MAKGKLILISTPLSDNLPDTVIPKGDLEIINNLRHFVVENVRTARRFLKKVNRDFPIDDCQFSILDKETDRSSIHQLIQPAIDGHHVGLLSEAGAPAIADPGALLVEKAHELHIIVKPLIGPSSLLLALMASGFNGQAFAFNGYLPIKSDERKKKIKYLESLAHQSGAAQMFIETPYRNNQLLQDILAICNKSTKLCIAADLHGNKQKIITQTVAAWKKSTFDFHKIPAVFILQ